MAKYDWTEELSGLDWSGVDALEIDGCVDLGEDSERADGRRADFFSVYLHRTGAGAECIADRPTAAEARTFAASLATPRGLLVYDFA